MEAVARQFGEGRKVLVIRNGYFSYRWSQLFDSMAGSTDVTVKKATPDHNNQYKPPPVEEVVDWILKEKPSLVCAPHVETSIGLILPRAYCMAVAAACKEVGAIFVLDGIASGNAWVNMNDGTSGARETSHASAFLFLLSCSPSLLPLTPVWPSQVGPMSI